MNQKSPIKSSSENLTEIFEVIIIVILIIILIVISTIAVYFANRRRDCYTYASPWCYRDWMCPNQPEGQQNTWTNLMKAGLIGDENSNKCFPIASDGVNPKFAGSTFTPPQMCNNAWSNFLGPNNKKPSDDLA